MGSTDWLGCRCNPPAVLLMYFYACILYFSKKYLLQKNPKNCFTCVFYRVFSMWFGLFCVYPWSDLSIGKVIWNGCCTVTIFWNYSLTQVVFKKWKGYCFPIPTFNKTFLLNIEYFHLHEFYKCIINVQVRLHLYEFFYVKNEISIC